MLYSGITLYQLDVATFCFSNIFFACPDLLDGHYLAQMLSFRSIHTGKLKISAAPKIILKPISFPYPVIGITIYGNKFSFSSVFDVTESFNFPV
jgi:hypothetical protein